ncbi:MAG: LAGLIDADG family homing endonuclease [Patescibacteria group bacterium]|nr:LAGLIDADG family homing endonuclease [Patescibacteria group bacterium]
MISKKDFKKISDWLWEIPKKTQRNFMKYLNLKLPKHSYFFGFIQADGTLRQYSRNRGYLEIELNKKDKEILEFFRKLFPFCPPIKSRIRNTNFKKNHESNRLRMFPKKFRDELLKLGFFPGKKFLNIFPPKCSFSEKDYIRGLIDGDGSVGISKRGFPFISISVKSEALKNYLYDVIEKITGEKKRLSRNKRDNIYNIMVNKGKAQRFIRYLYYPNCLVLKRKLKKAQQALKWKRPKTLKRVFQKFWLPYEDQYILNHSIEESCNYLKRTEKSIKMRLWRLNNHKASYLKACLNRN